MKYILVKFHPFVHITNSTLPTQWSTYFKPMLFLTELHSFLATKPGIKAPLYCVLFQGMNGFHHRFWWPLKDFSIFILHGIRLKCRISSPGHCFFVGFGSIINHSANAFTPSPCLATCLAISWSSFNVEVSTSLILPCCNTHTMLRLCFRFQGLYKQSVRNQNSVDNKEPIVCRCP